MTLQNPAQIGDHELLPPHLAFACETRVEVDPPSRIGGHGPQEVLSFVAITGGTVTGPRLNGVILPHGGDWYTDRGGVVSLDARYLIKADDGAIIDVASRGCWLARQEQGTICLRFFALD